MSEWMNQTTIHWTLTVSEKLAASIDTFSESYRGAAPVLFWRLAPGLSTPSPTVLMDWRRYQRALEASQGLWNHCSRSANTLHVVKLSEIFFITKTKVYRIRTMIWLTFQNLVTTNYDLFVICFCFRYMINNNLHANWTAFRLIKELKGLS